jgi:Protein of unknown function (DUF1616)
MRLKHPNLALSTAIALADVVWAVLPGHSPAIGLALALPLIFFLPGYTLTEALFHKRSLDIVHRMLLSLGLSLAIDIPGGLLLNVFPFGLRSTSWSGLLAALTIVFAGLAVYLRRGTVLHEKRPRATRAGVSPAPTLYGRGRPLRSRVGAGLAPALVNWHNYLLFGLAAAVVMLSVAFSAVSVAQQPHAGFTQLWLLPPDAGNKSCAIHVGVQSYELHLETYRIDMTANGAQVNMWPLVVLAPRQKWEQLASIGSNGRGSVYIEVRLYRASNLQVVYREVNVTLHIVSGMNYCQATGMGASLSS